VNEQNRAQHYGPEISSLLGKGSFRSELWS